MVQHFPTTDGNSRKKAQKAQKKLTKQDGSCAGRVIVRAKVYCLGAFSSRFPFVLFAPFCGYSDPPICVNLRLARHSGAAADSSAVAWHPFAVSFVVPRFHDWQRT
jgi:hypothetical protein